MIKINKNVLQLIISIIFGVVISSIFLSCSDTINCTEEARAGLNVFVIDSITQEHLIEEVLVIAKDGSYIDTLMYIDGIPPSYAGAWERKGTYQIIAEKEGYNTYMKSSIIVEADECHVIPRIIHVMLQKQE